VRKLFVILVGFAALLAGCGGGGSAGGGPSGPVLTGTVIDVATNAAPNPVVTVTVGSTSVQTNLTTGAFSMVVLSGSTSLTITQSGGPAFTYTFPLVTTSVNVGTLYVGAQSVSLAGKVLAAATSTPLGGVAVTALGRTGQTQSNGTYSLADIAWSSGAPSALQATFDLASYLPATSSLSTGTLNGAVLTLPDVNLVAAVNVSGLVISASGGNSVRGAVIAFRDAGGVEVGRGTTGADGTFNTRVTTSAVSMYVVSMPSGYYQMWSYLANIYTAGLPSTCSVTIPAPTEGTYYGTFLAFPAGDVPPPPGC
jgi:hypothetical protein